MNDLVTLYGPGAIIVMHGKDVIRSSGGRISVPSMLVPAVLDQGFTRTPSGASESIAPPVPVPAVVDEPVAKIDLPTSGAIVPSGLVDETPAPETPDPAPSGDPRREEYNEAIGAGMSHDDALQFAYPLGDIPADLVQP